MTVDPSDPATFEDESDTPFDVEAPEDDITDEQPTDLDPDKANEADVAEQARVVALDEDDYR
ncbi:MULTISPECIES: hypothetical protein [unclassified Streptomyces]|jgi:hypothetical protein|uniref:hypothetical protein n=1 Tax=unclassified Streptomyces TaxID=2593676 RepID=UPI0005258393|nr:MULTISPECIES: hypothetical protein [unclassified Streptomyces]WOX12404.1 hypothetical protein R2B38_27790 [Streptomyces sp. N50]